MGTYTELTVAGYPVVCSKSAVVPEVMTIFRESDRRVVDRRIDARNPLVWGEQETNDETERVIEYSCTARQAIDRLDVMGFTMRRARWEYEEGRRAELERLEGRLKEGHVDWCRRERDTVKTLGFDQYSDCLGTVVSGGLRPQPFEDRDAPGLDGGVRYILSDHYERILAFMGGDVRLVIRVICDLVGPHAEVVQDVTELVDGGYYGEDERICEDAIRDLTAGHPADAPRIVLTEGSTDSTVLKSSLTLLYPHLEGYYSFFDFESSRSPGGAGYLVAVVKAFAASGISNRVVALFDNDTAAREAVRSLSGVALPSSIAVKHYPDLPLLRRYPTLGPSGLSTLDVNGLAASIELYLGEDILRTADETLSPVRWTGYNDLLRCYQGSVGDKTRLLNKFGERVELCRADPSALGRTDWSGLDAILQTVFHAFDEP